MWVPIRHHSFCTWLNSYRFLIPIQPITTPAVYRFQSYLIDQNLDLMPLALIEAKEDLFKIWWELEQRVRSVLDYLGYGKEETTGCITAISELCQNIYHHGEPATRPRGYVAVQADRRGLRFMAMSLGPTIAANLRRKYAVADDGEAICLACQAGITSTDSGGLGLYQTLRVIQRAGGCVHIHSGNARVHFGTTGAHQLPVDQRLGWRGYLRGTLVGFFIPGKTRESVIV